MRNNEHIVIDSVDNNTGDWIVIRATVNGRGVTVLAQRNSAAPARLEPYGNEPSMWLDHKLAAMPKGRGVDIGVEIIARAERIAPKRSERTVDVIALANATQDEKKAGAL